MEHLVPLINIYSRRSYDPITEERYVTERVLSDRTHKNKTDRVNQTAEAREAQAFNLIRALGNATVKTLIERSGWSNSKVCKTLIDLEKQELICKSEKKPYVYNLIEMNA